MRRQAKAVVKKRAFFVVTKKRGCGAGGWNGCARLAAALSTATADYNAILHMVAMRMMLMMVIMMGIDGLTAK